MIANRGKMCAAALVVSVVAGLSAGAVAAPAVDVVDKDAWGWSFGGPFAVRDHDFGFQPAGKGQFGAAEDTFLTFCVERFADIDEGERYDVGFSEAADHGGWLGSEDPLDSRTAFLYTAFLQGTLDDKLGDTCGGFEYEEWESGIALQQAIWKIEDEQLLIGGLARALVQLADAAVAEGGEWYGRGLGNVRVMNLSSSGDWGGDNIQDMLVMIPLPMPVAMGLVGVAGVMGISMMRRRRLKQALAAE